MNKLNSLSLSVLASTGMLASPVFAQVAAPDTTEAVTYLETHGPTVIAAIGGVMIILAAVAVLFKWAKASIFG